MGGAACNAVPGMPAPETCDGADNDCDGADDDGAWGQGDLVIVDINAVGPSGYFIDFVRCFKCGGP